eukprot:2343711-Pyramimonas_sp.AAC.1
MDESAYSDRLSKWKADVLLTANDNTFWLTLFIANRTRSPSEHLSRWLQSATTSDSRPRSIDFVCVKGRQFANEWVDLLLEGNDAKYWGPVRRIADPDEQALRRSRVVHISLCMAADYNRRVMVQVADLPLRILALAFAHPLEPCDERRELAASLLQAAEAFPGAAADLQCDATSKKFVDIFAPELARCRDEGRGALDRQLWAFVNAIAREWKLDTQEIEGVNSIIKTVWKRSPAIAWPLLSARMSMRKFLE